MSFSSSYHSSFPPRRTTSTSNSNTGNNNNGDVADLRPILASMDNLRIGSCCTPVSDTNNNTTTRSTTTLLTKKKKKEEESKSSTKTSSTTTTTSISCLKCNKKDFRRISYCKPTTTKGTTIKGGLETMMTGICCRICFHKQKNKNNGKKKNLNNKFGHLLLLSSLEIYCQDCINDNEYCGTCQRYYCKDCFHQVGDLIDRQGKKYCSRKCAKNRPTKDCNGGGKAGSATTTTNNKNKKRKGDQSTSNQKSSRSNNPYSMIASSSSAQEAVAHHQQSTTTIAGGSSSSSFNNNNNQSRRQQKSYKYACAWCTKRLTTTNASSCGLPKNKDDDDAMGYYCSKCCTSQPKIYCIDCAKNQGDFCTGSTCHKFICRNCIPYDGWWTMNNDHGGSGGVIFCSKDCVTPSDLRHQVFRRTLFDEDWEAEEYFRPLSRRCQGFVIHPVTGQQQPCKVTASHPCKAAKSLKQGDDYCLNHGGFDGCCAVSDIDEDDGFDDSSSSDDDYYFDSSRA